MRPSPGLGEATTGGAARSQRDPLREHPLDRRLEPVGMARYTQVRARRQQQAQRRVVAERAVHRREIVPEAEPPDGQAVGGARRRGAGVDPDAATAKTR
ncbi:hypothetical protein J1G44_12220 [Cellulomonas sp. zg-ZUI199]|uniref:Uncharacterized protein n=1 Tax=Cellulomonas wangleii TaxID=2816956 RepID=A0ABX8D197_9CELL|nr:hypothetical protein [Cellulomonas wangleii]MBO0925242.1 hypothetical protein [Cellulomonas wangleii]QVI61252.1 hypothetical protein KG103_12205 [Cellulomonas wangleii]